ncbi:MAG: hypothetical protein JSW68_03910, partial [Burkholderiales bacterium]
THEGQSGDVQPVERATYSDLKGQGGLAWSASRGGTSYEAGASLTGSSVQAEALRFGELGARAPKVDLAEYAVGLTRGETAVRLGHVSYGNHPLLVSGMSSRGLLVSARPWERLDVAFSALNGTAIVGYDNLFGLDTWDHRVAGVTVGYELLAERPGGLRVEFSLFDASIQSQVDFNAGMVPDAERSRGLGLRLLAASPEGRVRAEVAWARSRYVNPFDPLLAQGEALQPVAETRGEGRIVDLSFDLLRSATTFSEQHPLDVTLTLHHDQVDPLYKSLGAFFATDQRVNRVGLAMSMGGAQVQFGASSSVDNLRDVPTLLKTRTSDRSVNVALPLPSWFGPGDGSPTWWPSLNYGWQWVHQRAVNVPAIEDSGFADSHRPDQKNTSHTLNLSWAFHPVTFSYGLSYAFQDNRQPGRERADFRNLGHQVSGSWQIGDGLNATLGFGRTRSYSTEQALATYVNNVSLGGDWAITPSWSVAANLNKTLNTNSEDTSLSRNDGLQAQLTYRFELPGAGRPLPGQAFVRYSQNSARTRDDIFLFSSRQRAWFVDMGVSLSLF